MKQTCTVRNYLEKGFNKEGEFFYGSFYFVNILNKLR